MAATASQAAKTWPISSAGSKPSSPRITLFSCLPLLAMRAHLPKSKEPPMSRAIVVHEPGPGQVRLRQTAVGLNFIDVYHRTGLYPQPAPFIPGVEGAGIVEAIGAG